ncbi:homeobox-like protein HDP1 isoform X1 [Hylaeus volcanicus]|uniref:homeobox-like protein HDP1 isoform X1 n=1 Tax=Hylaeus volcanicus TaxID=313075 RepID=UPI0023B80D2E|nr:homeobox-like protein HDP1 isoform X1 [Hylaeus volcanicus]
MCDLIDLNSPDTKGLLSTQLASPLIPVPKDTAYDNYNDHANETRSLATEKRNSLENNPFDMVLHKTTEYIQKKHDPFEVTLEKALRSKRKKNSSVDFTDSLKQKRYSQKLKMNRTLDESLINRKLNQKTVSTNKIVNENIVSDSNKTNMLNDENTNNPSTIDVQDANLSILNQSIMNDTLLEPFKELNKEETNSISQSKTLICMELDKVNINKKPTSPTFLRVPKLLRSHSQGEKVSPKRSYLKHLSLIESLRTNSESGSSIHSTDFMNEGFLNSRSDRGSVLSSISNISSMNRLSSVSSTSYLSTMLSDGTINRTFLESCSSEKSDNMKLTEQTDFDKEINLVSSISMCSITNASNKAHSSMSDLTDQFNKLKAKTLELRVLENSPNEKNEIASISSNNVKECMTVMEKNEECNTNNKLIDVDIFTPDMSSSKEQSKSSISDVSSDSVFSEENKMNKSILHEAKLLAKTFEDLAVKTSSGSSIDDLITNNSSWTLELLPAFDDEVDNLIELPTSPNINTINSANEKVVECSYNTDSCSNKRETNMKDLEMELIEPISVEKRVATATLLLDLKKLITAENNMEANKLLDNLETVLGINWKNNTELLTTYLNSTNDLSKSPQKSNSCLEIKNVTENNMEQSQEDNLNSSLSNDVKGSVICADMNLNDSNMSKYSVDNQKNVKEINDNENELDTQNICKKDSSCRTDNNNSFENEKIVMELLTNLGKLLTGQTKEHSSLNLLKNLGKVLNCASNNCDTNENIKNDSNKIKIQHTSKKSKIKVENKSRTSILSKSDNRLSLDLESKKQPVSKNFIRRSISVSQTPPTKNLPRPLMSKGKNASQLKQVTKRFPSDPGFISSTSSTTVITHNNKEDVEKGSVTVPILDLQKEKTTMISSVKTKLKKKIGGDISQKKGPLKAVLPIGSMHKRESISKKVSPITDAATPPKFHKIISSTPNSIHSTAENKCTTKRYSRSSKPVASSTPDAQNSKTCKVQSQITNGLKKRNFSCDISPVTTRVNLNDSNGTNNSPKRVSKLPSPKRTTPKRCPVNSSIPKSQTPPVSKRLNSSFDVNQYERLCKSPQRLSHKRSISQKNSPISMRNTNGSTQCSPLRDSNKIIHKVKPINLISKLRRHSIGTNVMEKENNYI